MGRDKYKNFEELRSNEAEGKQFCVRTEERPGSVIVIAPHGGGIERGTSEIAEAIAEDRHSLYSFEGLKESGNADLHITSTNFDEPRCCELVERHQVVVALHGLEGRLDRVDVGGLDAKLRDRVSQELEAAGFPSVIVDSGPHAATSPRNICNRGHSQAGVQLEVTRSLRDSLRGDPQRLCRFARAVQEAIEAATPR